MVNPMFAAGGQTQMAEEDDANVWRGWAGAHLKADDPVVKAQEEKRSAQVNALFGGAAHEGEVDVQVTRTIETSRTSASTGLQVTEVTEVVETKKERQLLQVRGSVTDADGKQKVFTMAERRRRRKLGL